MKHEPNHSPVTLRKAVLADSESIACVHIKSWQEAYHAILPQNYLDQLPNELNERIETWNKILTNSQRWTLVAENKKGIVGFVLFGPPRDPDKETYVELGAIYLLASEKNKGVGFSLLSAGFNWMKDKGYQKSYCWVLENNPTIKFYERSGAHFTGPTKVDEIEGMNYNELAYEWKSLTIGDYNWKPLSVDEVRIVFESFKQQWWIAGGWAIDLFLKKQTRHHDDIDILISRDDQHEMQSLLKDWDVWVADPPGTLRPLKHGEVIKKGLQDIWVRKTPTDPWQIQIMLFDVEQNEWIFKRDESIRRSLDSITIKTAEGLMLLAPEVQLLYKSKSLREKDQKDFESVLPAMSNVQRDWLKSVLIKVYQDGHEWIGVPCGSEDLRESFE